MRTVTILCATLALASPALAQTAAPGSGKPAHAEAVKVPRSAAVSARALSNTDRVIDGELKRIDHMMTICNGC